LKILVAPDKFKGSMTARAAGDAMRDGLLRVWPDAEIDVVPVADGGDGTAEAILEAVGGKSVRLDVTGPDGRPVKAAFALLAPGDAAVVEMAQASGLALLPAGSNDPLTATSFGTGELIAAAIDAGARRVLLAVGGSATNDGGTGALSALGARFLDERGAELPRGGAALGGLAAIDDAPLRKRLHGIAIDIASDVDNPLVGPNGASAIYAPQKGATPDAVRVLDAALTRFADVAAQTTGADIRAVPGAGAAGGTAGGFIALAGAKLDRGANLVLELIGFERRLDGTALVVTGEGKLDRQTLAGKAPYAVAQAARRRGVPAAAVAGVVDVREDDLERLGLTAAEALVAPGVTPEQAMHNGPASATAAAERLGRTLQRILGLHERG